MIHSFQTEDAANYGLVEAVMLNNFRHWIGQNQANGKNQRDDRTWTYNSVKAFGLLFDYLSSGQIRRCLDSLVSQGVLVRANYNESGYDKTSWYAFADDSFCQIDLSKTTNQSDDSGKSEADIKHTVKQKTKGKGAICVLPDGFEPDETGLTLAKTLGLNVEQELAAFADHHAANGSTFKDWQAAYRTWLRNAVKFFKRGQRITPLAKPVETFKERDARHEREAWERETGRIWPKDEIPGDAKPANYRDLVEVFQVPEVRRLA